MEGEFAADQGEKSFKSVEIAQTPNTTSSSLGDALNGVQGAVAQATNKVFDALKEIPEKLFALVALIGFIVICYSGNMKEWRELIIFLIFIFIDIGFLIIYEKLKSKEESKK